jgi:hypothetical protein
MGLANSRMAWSEYTVVIDKNIRELMEKWGAYFTT